MPILLSLLLSSCSTMSTDECKTVNWRDKGFEDAMQGNPVHLSRHRKACAAVKVIPNRAVYMSGYNAGSRQFCTYQSGLRFGKEGKLAANICSAPGIRGKFFEGYNKGKRIYNVNSQILSKESEIYQVDKKIKKARKRSSVAELDLLYREKELIYSEIAALRRELIRIN